jgi:hypothetical protein
MTIPCSLNDAISPTREYEKKKKKKEGGDIIKPTFGLWKIARRTLGFPVQHASQSASVRRSVGSCKFVFGGYGCTTVKNWWIVLYYGRLRTAFRHLPFWSFDKY